MTADELREAIGRGEFKVALVTVFALGTVFTALGALFHDIGANTAAAFAAVTGTLYSLFGFIEVHRRG